MDKQNIKEKLEKEQNALLEELNSIGKLNTDTGEWEAVPEDLGYTESDQNDMADRFEDFESRSSMVGVLESRLSSIEQALKNINKESFGLCKICKKSIEMARMEANPAADTCKKHLEN